MIRMEKIRYTFIGRDPKSYLFPTNCNVPWWWREKIKKARKKRENGWNYEERRFRYTRMANLYRKRWKKLVYNPVEKPLDEIDERIKAREILIHARKKAGIFTFYSPSFFLHSKNFHPVVYTWISRCNYSWSEKISPLGYFRSYYFSSRLKIISEPRERNLILQLYLNRITEMRAPLPKGWIRKKRIINCKSLHCEEIRLARATLAIL